ncbi:MULTISPECIES: hypothetical protein [unclassified Microcoleus]|uniref:hypothetical protein n=1 Tax=unclassified Microcoleus TaxID=2642155 RepID=UPI002FD344BA
MPVPQSSLFLVERASSPLLILVQDVGLNSDVALFSLNGLDARSTIKFISCGTGF